MPPTFEAHAADRTIACVRKAIEELATSGRAKRWSKSPTLTAAS